MMRRYFILLFVILSVNIVYGQEVTKNTADKLMSNTNSKVQIGGYAQIDYNQPVNAGEFSNGNLDVHRLVLLFGYRFSERANFVTEIEVEHVKEIFVEQAFLNYKILPWLDFRGGLMLVPMGIINEYHEPPTFNGVERPNLDSKVVPTTWREIGAGFTGRFDNASLKYQLYIMNGFVGYNDEATFRGTDGLRKGRQKGAESIMSSPTLSTKIDYYGITGLKLGLSTYNGKSQSSLYDGIEKGDDTAISSADSSVVGISMVGFDARYVIGGFEARGQMNVTNIKNTDQYNDFTGKDLGSQLFGWYAEVGYNLLHSTETEQKLIPFIRYEIYNTHAKTEGALEINDAFDRKDVTVGAGWWVSSGAVLKMDYQFLSSATGSTSGMFNMGIGIWF
ncbi:MAG: hypothetical protein KAH68_00700 [Draconibacterium sp.]|nr:hypothetical protein [Draconibacterium sp.]